MLILRIASKSKGSGALDASAGAAMPLNILATLRVMASGVVDLDEGEGGDKGEGEGEGDEGAGGDEGDISSPGERFYGMFDGLVNGAGSFELTAVAAGRAEVFSATSNNLFDASDDNGSDDEF